MTGNKRLHLARIVVTCIALAVMVFILLVGMVSHATLTANIFLGLFFVGWIPAALVLESSFRQSGEKSPRYSSRARIVIVLLSALVAVGIAAVIVPLLAYPLVSAVTVFVMLLGFLPTSALALLRSSRSERSRE